MKKFVSALLCLVMLLGLSAPALAAKGVTKLRIEPRTLTLDVGISEQLTLIFKPDGASAAVKWKSSKPSVATVDEDGVVTAMSAGSATIQAKTKKGKSAKCQVIVRDQDMVLAFTFDDGPNSNTLRILKAFEKAGGKATFFMLGSMARDNAETAKAVADAGMTIGNHTMDHKSLRLLDMDGKKEELNKGFDAIETATGTRPTLVRAPYGNISQDDAAELGYTFVQWSIDPEDWKDRDANTVYQRILSKVKPNSIILMHDIYSSTAEAVEKLLPSLSRKGYRFVSIPELLEFRKISDASGTIIF